ncbi:MAG TPA: hypothetical protein DD379_06490 [Cyanobacteria bacterium UBA11162]|nr:hypothetical protein [Cyanobacteria bacterium UBA11162]
MNSLELDREIGKIARAIMTRNREIGSDVIAYLTTQLTVDFVAGMLLVSIERVIWFDADSVVWAIETIIPVEIMQEIQRMMSFSLYKQLVSKGYVPGKDISVNASGVVLFKDRVRKAA